MYFKSSQFNCREGQKEVLILPQIYLLAHFNQVATLRSGALPYAIRSQMETGVHAHEWLRKGTSFKNTEQISREYTALHLVC